jgi:hypothetical protein
MQLQAGIIPVIGAFLVAEFKARGATNYLAIECNTEELGPMVLTIQRKWGKQPAQVAASEHVARERAEAERDRLREALHPFQCLPVSPRVNDADVIYERAGIQITAGHVRAARALLKAPGHE